MRRILVVTYYYPPSTASGANRWAAMVRHLRGLGHRVWVITSASGGSGEHEEADVTRATDLVTSPRLRRALRRPPLAVTGRDVVETAPPALLTTVLVPDSYVISWVPWAVREARRRIAASSIECVITSSPPDSAHLTGLLLGPRRPAWIADFRDGWTFEPLRPPWPTAAQRALDRGLERRVAARAEAVLGATRPIVDDLQARLHARAHWISNGWDPLGDGEIEAAAARPAGAAMRLVHTGTLSLPGGRDPRVLLAALRSVNEGAPSPLIKLVLAGRVTDVERELIEDAGESVEHVGLLDRAGAIALQRSADALLLLTGNNRSEATGKLFEYLAAELPIIALAGDNEAARIVRGTGSGVVVPPDDQAAIEAALRALVDGSLPRLRDARSLEPYIYPGPARALLEVIEQAITRRVGD